MDRLLRTLGPMSLDLPLVRSSRSQGTRTGALARGTLALLLVVPCGAGVACTTGEAAAPLTETFGSPEDLAREVVDALNHRDANRLLGLALTEPEFKAHVWPHLPANRPERAVPFGFVWTRLHHRSTAHLGAVLATHGGRDLRVVSVRFRGETTDYGPFEVRRSAEVIIREADGRERAARLFGSVLVQGGRCKLFSYVVD